LICEAQRKSPSHETPTIDDVGAMAAFLVSDGARHITATSPLSIAAHTLWDEWKIYAGET